MAYEVRSVNGRQEVVCEDADSAAQAVLDLRRTLPVRWRTSGGRTRDLNPDELADLRSAVKFQREARKRFAVRPTVQPVPVG